MTRKSGFLKWVANAVVIAAAVSLSFGFPETGRLLFLLGSALWFLVGWVWREASIWTMNLFLVAIYIVGYIR